jgi:hypothetical protein
VRDGSDWYKDLAGEIDLTDALPVGEMSPKDFFSLELGLFFLAEYFPDEPVGALWPLLSGYVLGPAHLWPIVRRLRILLGDNARRGYWRHNLNDYRRIPLNLRGFDHGSTERVTDRSVFASQSTVVCADRQRAYREALDTPVPYVIDPNRELAEPGATYSFKRRDGHTELVSIPGFVVPKPAPRNLETVTARQRAAVSVKVSALRAAARRIERILEDFPEETNRDFPARLKKVRYAAVDRANGNLVEAPKTLEIDGVAHLVGLMNSGKSTLADLLTVERVAAHFHVTLVLPSVSDVMAKTSFLRRLGIRAVPLIGNSSRAEHADRYWRTTLEASPTPFPEAEDPAARFAAAACLLDPHRHTNRPEWDPLPLAEAPCRSMLRDDEGGIFDCPLLAVCPAQAAEREVADAQVWVTTAQGLALTKAGPSQARMRWLEMVQHHSDLIIVDEADVVQNILDGMFLQTEVLSASRQGWTDRTSIGTRAGLDRADRRPLRDKKVNKFNRFDRIHGRAVDEFYHLALDHEELREIISGSPFTGHRLLLSASRILHGIALDDHQSDSDLEDAADDFFRLHLEQLANDSLERTVEGFEDLVTELKEEFPDEETVTAILNDWLRRHNPDPEQDGGRRAAALSPKLPILRLLLLAGYWASRITSSFFELSTLYPGAAEHLDLADPDTFWQHQPPRDYQPFVPEAPMGNLLALQWLPVRQGDTGALRVLWVRGIGRWLLHHLHDLLAPEGVDGPHTLLTSATSYIPGSSYYHVAVPPTAVLREPEADRKALRTSVAEQLTIRRADKSPVFVSGRYGAEREDALRAMVTGICTPRPGQSVSVLERVRDGLSELRRQVLFVVQSGLEAKFVAEYVNTHTRYTARNITPDAAEAGAFGLHRRLVGSFASTGADILVAAEMAIQRGYNILNKERTAALGAVFYLVRPHPPANDPAFPLSLISQDAMAVLANPKIDPDSVFEAAKKVQKSAYKYWYGLMSLPVFYRRLADPRVRDAFIGNALVPFSQTVGRTIRGNAPTHVLLCDGAFMPRRARGDGAPDTVRTSLLLGMQDKLHTLLLPPPPGAPLERVLEHSLAEATWSLQEHLLTTLRLGG